MRDKNSFSGPSAHRGYLDFLIVGAGPAGLACALELSSFQQSTVILDKGCIADSIYRFPDAMRFFSDGTSLEFGGFPMAVRDSRPTRAEAICYYREVVRQAGLDVLQRETVLSIDGWKGDFHVRTNRGIHRTRHVVLATGFYGEPNLLNVPGESLHKVAHYYRDAHPYFGHNVAVIGGRNSAGIVASELADAGAHVTLIHHRDRFNMKPWIASGLQSRIQQGSVAALMQSSVTMINESSVSVKTLGSSGDVERTIDNDFVFAMTGYRPDFEFLIRNGLPLTDGGTRPVYDPETLESGRPGVYFAGAVMAGIHTHEIAIEAARGHGAKIAAAALSDGTGSICRGSDSQIGEVGHHAWPDP